jgi:hypothetical protein
MAEEKEKKKAAPKKKKAQVPDWAKMPWGWLSVAFIFLFVIGFLSSQLLFPPKTETAQVTVPVTVQVLKEVEVTVEVPVTMPAEVMSEASAEEPTATPMPPTSTPEPPPTQAPVSGQPSGALACTEIVSVGHGSEGTLIVVAVPGVPGGSYPALVNNYLDDECKTDPNYPDRLYCQVSRLAAGPGNIDISDAQGNLFCELNFTIP